MKLFGLQLEIGLREGKGSVRRESRALEYHPYTFFTADVKAGTIVMMLLGAAHAACFTMSFSNYLGMANSCRRQVDRNRSVLTDKTPMCFSITSVGISQSPRRCGASTMAAFHQSPAKANVVLPCLQRSDWLRGQPSSRDSAMKGARVDRPRARLLLERDDISLGHIRHWLKYLSHSAGCDCVKRIGPMAIWALPSHET